MKTYEQEPVNTHTHVCARVPAHTPLHPYFMYVHEISPISVNTTEFVVVFHFHLFSLTREVWIPLPNTYFCEEWHGDFD